MTRRNRQGLGLACSAGVEQGGTAIWDRVTGLSDMRGTVRNKAQDESLPAHVSASMGAHGQDVYGLSFLYTHRCAAAYEQKAAPS